MLKVAEPFTPTRTLSPEKNRYFDGGGRIVHIHFADVGQRAQRFSLFCLRRCLGAAQGREKQKQCSKDLPRCKSSEAIPHLLRNSTRSCCQNYRHLADRREDEEG